jgi:hypothetical protein
MLGTHFFDHDKVKSTTHTLAKSLVVSSNMSLMPALSQVASYEALDAQLPELFVGHLGAHGSFSGVWASKSN